MNGVPPEFESWMRPEPDSDATRVMPAPGRTPQRFPTPGAPPVQTLPPAFPPPAAPVKKRRRWPIKRIVLIVVAVWLVYVLAVATVFATSVHKIAALPASHSASSSGSNYLLVGSDSRKGLTKKQQRRLHTGATEGQRTDTIMIMHVPLVGTPTLISLPRDSWVPIPGQGSNKLNAAFAIGGPQLLVQTVEETTGLEINHYVEIGFAGIAQTTNALGGVKLCPKQNFDDQNSGLHVKKGCQTMNGRDALAYVRMRYADPRGDLGRVERQQEFMSAVAKRSMSPLTWLMPWRSFGAAKAAGDALTVDKSTGIVDDTRLAIAMGMIAMGWGESTTVPTEEGTYWAGGQAAVKWNTAKAQELFNSID